MNAESSPSLVECDDLFELRKEALQRLLVTACVKVALRGMEEPQRGVSRVIESFSGSLRKHVGDESVPDILREGSQDVSGLLHTASYERQPFKGDHRVAAPVCEPVIAGKDRALFVAISMRPRRILEAVSRMDDELIGGKYKIRAEGRERLAGHFDETLTPVAFSGTRLGW